MNLRELAYAVQYFEALLDADATRLGELPAQLPPHLTLDLLAAGFAQHCVANTISGDTEVVAAACRADLRHPAPVDATVSERLQVLHIQAVLHWAHQRGDVRDHTVGNHVLELLRFSVYRSDHELRQFFAGIRKKIE